jgi:hypothetical protein
MEKPFLTHTTKDFLTGIAPSAHAQSGGLFFKADGITALTEAGKDQSTLNGLLTTGSSATTASGSLSGAVISAAISPVGTTYFGTDANHIHYVSVGAGLPFGGALNDAHTAGHTLTPGMVYFTDSSANEYLLYRQFDQIGRFDTTTWTDNWQATTTDYFGAIHEFQNQIFFGNGPGALGRISSAMAVTLTALTLPKGFYTTAISDDGTYPILAITRNKTVDPTLLTDTRILFWDGANTSAWLREYAIPDPLIYKLEKTPIGVFAFGVSGIWQVSLGGVKKVFNRSPGIYTNASVSASVIHYGNVTSFFSDSVIWGGSSGSNYAVKALGKLDSAYGNAYSHPFLSTASKNITYLNAQLLKGWVFVGDDTPLLKAYPFSTANSAQTGNTAQTVYFEVPTPMQLKKIRITFGVPLASGDSISAAVYTDESSASVSFGTAAYSATKTTRSYTFNANTPAQVEDAFSLLLTFPAGAVRIKKIEYFGDPVDRRNA